MTEGLPAAQELASQFLLSCVPARRIALLAKTMQAHRSRPAGPVMRPGGPDWYTASSNRGAHRPVQRAGLPDATQTKRRPQPDV